MTDLAALEARAAPRAWHRRLPSPPRFLLDLVRYGLCSAAALGLDWGLLVAFVAGGVPYLPAAAVSFSAGMAVAYFGSIAFVFSDRRRGSMLGEAAGFVAVGLAGLICNQALLWFFVQGVGLHVAIAKAPTAACVFLFNFFLRRSLVFAGGR